MNNKKLFAVGLVTAFLLVPGGAGADDNADGSGYRSRTSDRTATGDYPQMPPPGPWGNGQASGYRQPAAGYQAAPRYQPQSGGGLQYLQQELARTRDQLQRKQILLKEANAALDRTLTDLHQSLLAQRTLNDSLATARTAQLNAEQQLAELGTELEKTRTAKAQLANRLADMEALRARLAEVETRLEQAQGAEQQLAALQEKLRDAESAASRLAELEDRLRTAEAARQRLAELENRLADAEADRQRLAQLGAELEIAQAARTGLEERLAGMEQLEQQLRGLTARLGKAGETGQQLAELQARLADAEADRQRLAELERKLEQTRTARLQESRQLEQSRSEVETLSAELASLREQLVARDQRLASLEAELQTTALALQDRREQQDANDRQQLAGESLYQAWLRSRPAAGTSQPAIAAAATEPTPQPAATAAGSTATSDAVDEETVTTTAETPAATATDEGQPDIAVAALESHGRPAADADGDGIADAADFCPETPAGTAVGETGCEAGKALVMSGVRFRYDSHELTGRSRAVLDRIAGLLKQHPALRFEIAGHSDAQGNPAYNEWLSQQRAEEVRRYLVARGVRPEQLTAHGYGASQPLASNDTREGLVRNRRVELRRLP